MKIFIIILFLIVSVPAAYGHAVIIGSSVNEIPHDHPPNEYESTYAKDFGKEYLTGFSTEATVTGIGIMGGIVVLVVLGGAIAVTVFIIFGKDMRYRAGKIRELVEKTNEP